MDFRAPLLGPVSPASGQVGQAYARSGASSFPKRADASSTDGAATVDLSAAGLSRIAPRKANRPAIQEASDALQSLSASERAVATRLGRLKELVDRAASGATGDDERKSIQEEAQRLLGEIDKIGENVGGTGRTFTVQGRKLTLSPAKLQSKDLGLSSQESDTAASLGAGGANDLGTADATALDRAGRILDRSLSQVARLQREAATATTVVRKSANEELDGKPRSRGVQEVTELAQQTGLQIVQKATVARFAQLVPDTERVNALLGNGALETPSGASGSSAPNQDARTSGAGTVDSAAAAATATQRDAYPWSPARVGANGAP